MANTATPFLDAVAKRRTVYTLGNTSPIDKSRIIEIVHHSLKYCPSPFNVRTCRIIILFGEDHTKLWEHTKEVVPEHIPAEFRDFLVARIDGALAAYGTVIHPAVVSHY
jgi:predicted oxidoreductase (fatty acid repression mutant protein)